MWRLYVGDDNGLAVESTYERPTSSFRGERNVFVGMVRYVDWQEQVIPKGNTFQERDALGSVAGM
jgi:hypothetical protein